MANEKRLIDANEIEELFYKQVEFGATDLMDAFDDALQDAQAVDAVEVVHGSWDKSSQYGLSHKFNHLGVVCSACACYCDNLYNYCPHCGAKMDGGNDDGNSDKRNDF